MLQFDDLIWDEFEESTIDMVQEPYEDDKHTTWATENDARRNLQQEPSLVLLKNLGFISQCSGASSSFVIPNTEGRQQLDVGSKPGLLFLVYNKCFWATGGCCKADTHVFNSFLL